MAIRTACTRIRSMVPGQFVVASDNLSSIQMLGQVSGPSAFEFVSVLEVRKIFRELSGEGYEKIFAWISSYFVILWVTRGRVNWPGPGQLSSFLVSFQLNE